jgi:hypothetical protein
VDLPINTTISASLFCGVQNRKGENDEEQYYNNFKQCRPDFCTCTKNNNNNNNKNNNNKNNKNINFIKNKR